MAKRAKTKPARKTPSGQKKAAKRKWFRSYRLILKWGSRAMLAMVGIAFLMVVLYALVNPPTTYFMWSEGRRLDSVKQEWVSYEDIPSHVVRSVVAAEDANFCQHWGFDMRAIRAALAEGSRRGASTISQQTVKNAYLWHGRSWLRKAMEAMLTPMVEAVWSKQRILEVYLNIAEFGEGVFGVEAAAQHYFRVGAKDLTTVQAARLAAVLPSPKTRSASNPSSSTRRRAAAIMDGAATIRADGRSACFDG
ncbi:monofunctional biosynthetic peptidoglycan transglycosylase [Pseudohalocynthiibacter aestuariivivens]|nr:monofunctional biosynthetic peptidoglycan transglycosylase [Pseudohalocynthiibacter aestuariivivens]